MSAVLKAWEEIWFGPVSRLRVWLMVRATALMLALDAWLLMIERGGRYGAGGFNVAHFAWVDALQPLPSAGFYVGLIVSCGLLSMLITLGAIRRVGVVALTLCYTYAWAMSQLDSYQHHVFISWILLTFCVTPWVKTHDLLQESKEICAWGYRLLIALTAILYFFTGVSKAEPEWLSGSVLQRINATGGDLEPFRELMMGWGAEEATFWTISGHGVVAVQWVIAAAWLSLILFGERAHIIVRVGRLIGVLCALAFHIGAEIAGLRIGWFSWYMLGMTAIAFSPQRWLQGALNLIATPLESARASLKGASRAPQALWIGLNLAAVGALYTVGVELDLPGTAGAALVWAMIALGITLSRLIGRKAIRHLTFALALSALCLSLSINHGRARYDFYRFVGGDALRRMQLHDALEAYGRANTYAPEGEGRWKKVVKAKALLRKTR